MAGNNKILIDLGNQPGVDARIWLPLSEHFICFCILYVDSCETNSIC